MTTTAVTTTTSAAPTFTTANTTISTETPAITSTGLGSGLDVTSLVSQIVAADRSAQDTLLTNKQTATNVQISAYGSLKSSLSSVESALQALRSGGSLDNQTVTSSDSSILTATAGSTAKSGQTTIEVLSLASVDRQASSAFTSSSALVGTGSMAFTIGGNSFTVNTTSSMTVAGLRDAINSASDNSGVTASLVTEDGGTRLLLTSKNTGTANAITVNTSLTSFTSLQAPTDAQVKVDGFTRTSSSNHLVNVTDGVDVDLSKASVGNPVTLTVASDTSAASTAVNNFVTAYNSFVTSYSSMIGYDTSTQTAGALMSAAGMNNIAQSMRSMLSANVASGTYTNLAGIGITSNDDGTLTVDSDKLSTALSTDGASVQNLFGGSDGTGGIADNLYNFVSGFADTGGTIDSRVDSLNKVLTQISSDQTALNDRMTQETAMYTAKFNALDSVVSTYKNIASYLDQMNQERYNKTT